MSFIRKIHPQFALGVFLGLSVTIILHTHKSMDVVIDFSKRLHFQKSEIQKVTNENTANMMESLNVETMDDESIHRMLDSGDNVEEHKFLDAHAHHDDDSLAQGLYNQVRVLCWIMTSPKNLHKKAIHVRNTWASRCNVMLFMSSEEDKDFPAIDLNVTEGRNHLTAKTMKAFSYIYENHFDDADWFMKADDDTYVIVENLRYMLSSEDPQQPVFFGHRFKLFIANGYPSGGGGYVISKEALKRFGETGRKNATLCHTDRGAEDVEMGRCLHNLDVVLKPSLDSLGRSRFHCFTPDAMINKKFPAWYYKYDTEGGLGGIENISDYAISFHYVPPEKMYSMEFYTYHLQPYGIINRPQNINVKSVQP